MTSNNTPAVGAAAKVIVEKSRELSPDAWFHDEWGVAYAQALAAASLLRAEPGPGWEKPIAWRVRDCAYGWIIYSKEKAAQRDAESRGALIEPLYSVEYVGRLRRANELAAHLLDNRAAEILELKVARASASDVQSQDVAVPTKAIDAVINLSRYRMEQRLDRHDAAEVVRAVIRALPLSVPASAGQVDE